MHIFIVKLEFLHALHIVCLAWHSYSRSYLDVMQLRLFRILNGWVDKSVEHIKCYVIFSYFTFCFGQIQWRLDEFSESVHRSVDFIYSKCMPYRLSVCFYSSSSSSSTILSSS